MKKMLALLVVSACVAGCGTAAKKSELWEHDSIYKSWDHMRFSLGGPQEVSQEEAKKSVAEGWWGKETTVHVQGQ
jgi:hypothetical protein